MVVTVQYSDLGGWSLVRVHATMTTRGTCAQGGNHCQPEVSSVVSTVRWSVDDLRWDMRVGGKWTVVKGCAIAAHNHHHHARFLVKGVPLSRRQVAGMFLVWPKIAGIGFPLFFFFFSLTSLTPPWPGLVPSIGWSWSCIVWSCSVALLRFVPLFCGTAGVSWAETRTREAAWNCWS